MRLLPTWSHHRDSHRRAAVVGGGIAVATLALPLLAALPAQTESGTVELPGAGMLILGAIIGTTYGLLGAGLVLVYRTSKIINFAHGQIGAFAAVIFAVIVTQWHVPYWVALPFGLALGGLTAALTEVVVVRRLRRAPRLMSIVATLGVGQFLLLLGAALNSSAPAGFLFPNPVGLPDFNIGQLRITPAFSGMLILSPILILMLGWFLKRSRFGIGIRSASDNAETAELVGIPASSMSSFAWALAGVLSAFTAILTAPTRGTTGDSFGPELLLMALAAGVLARMTNIPLTLVGGVALGVVEASLRWNYPEGGAVELTLFVIILVALLFQKQRESRSEEKGSWATVQAVRPLPEELRALWPLRNLGRIVGAIAFGIAVLLPFAVSHSAAISLTIIFAYAIVALSIGIVTGLGGQLTLGQFAYAGVGAVVSYYVSAQTGWFLLAFLYAGIVAAFAALIVGLPALRIRGLMITATTLAFALAAPGAIFEVFIEGGVFPGRPIVFGNPLEGGREYYFVGLFTLVVAFIVARNVRQFGVGRRLVAVRDNEDNARAFTIPATVVKMQGLMLAGFLAGLGGALYGHSFDHLGASAFRVDASINVVKIAVIGGISMLSGPLIGALFVMALPLFVRLGAVALAASSFGQLLVIMYLPKGLVQIIVPIRDFIARSVAARAGVDAAAAFARRDGHTDDSDENSGQQRSQMAQRAVAWKSPARGTARARSDGHAERLLEIRGLRKRFGGVHAVDGVSFELYRGETLGLIGPNGAGKTTAFELIGGFTRCDYGTVRYQNQDITWLSPEERGRRGLIRSFQDAGLFATMTVEEAVMLAGERTAPTKFFPAVTGIGTGEKLRRQQARAVIEFMGLGRYRTKQIMELSTGTRRITELACLIALEPTVLLLDEPSSGIAQRETEALGSLLLELKREFDMTLMIIEHDIPMITSLADRLIAMADGQILATGTPEAVRNDPRVVEAYLGGSITAIERSDTLPDVDPRLDGRAATGAESIERPGVRQ